MCHEIILDQMLEAHRTFRERENRDLFYRLATRLVEESFDSEGDFTLGESVFVLLQTWNQAFIRHHPLSIVEIEDLLQPHLR